MVVDGERALDALLRMKYFLASELGITRNHLLGIDGTDITCLGRDGVAMHGRIRDFLREKHAASSTRNEELLAELDGLISRTCNHDMVEDDIEDPLSGRVTRIRYCRVCGHAP